MAEPAPFTVAVDPGSRLIRLDLTGLWDLPTVDRYVTAARDAFAGLIAAGASPATIGILIDLRRQGVQPREVTERVQAAIGEGLSRGSRHAVLVSASALHRMQAQRLGTALAATFFTEEAAALAWLLDPSTRSSGAST